MKKMLLGILIICMTLCSQSITSAREISGYVPSDENLEAREEFQDMRFGIFIHWGIYSMFAQGEWYLNSGPDGREYAKAAGGFYPGAFNAKEWVKAIKAAGAKYICFTTRHHDGFSMFDSAYTDYDIMDASPFRRDIVAELADACHEEGITLHLYYSLVDWYRDDYPVGESGPKHGRNPEKADYSLYKEFMKNQLSELLTNYKGVKAIWFDGIWDHDKDKTPFDWGIKEIYSHIHGINPACLIGNNHHRDPFEGEDFQMFERDLPGENKAGWSENQKVSNLPLEMCQTMNWSWGYKVEDQSYKSVGELVHLIVRAAAKGSNILLNIGPQPDGNLPQKAIERLSGIGQWMDKYGNTIYGTEATDIPEQSWGVTTKKGNTLYLHVITPEGGCSSIRLPLQNKKRIRSVAGINTGERLKYQIKDGNLHIELPPVITTPDYIIKVELK